ncbi:MAG: hypothetical protein H6602_11270 [Flavobacteriales bacterium]|nr:hypothetical protein [Flavobacteriales bacterium]MCB9192235.1 hypothetical protein [Flavobacteriales bacterium]
MKSFIIFIGCIVFSAAGFAQKLNTSASLTATNMVTDEKNYNAIVEADLDEEISIDMVFDKIALIESLVFTDKELNAKNQKHLKEETEIVYFGNETK